MKRYRGYRIALLCLLMLYICSAAAYADSVVLGRMELIGGTDCTYWIQDGKTIKAEGATEENYNVKYDKQSAELTLRDVKIEEASTFSDAIWGIDNTALYIDVNGPISIILEGSNTIGAVADKHEYTATGIYLHKNVESLTIKDGHGEGKGSLNIVAKKHGIYFYSDINNKDKRLNFESGDVRIQVSSDEEPLYGIYLEDGVDVRINGGSVDITANTEKRLGGVCGIKCTTFEMTDGSLSISASGKNGEIDGIRAETVIYKNGSLRVQVSGSGNNKQAIQASNTVVELANGQEQQGSFDSHFVEIKNKEGSGEGAGEGSSGGNGEGSGGGSDNGNNEGSGGDSGNGNNEGSGGGSDNGNNEGSGGDSDNGNDEGSEGDSIGGGNEEPDKDQNDRTDEESIDGDVIAALPMTGDQNPPIALLMSVMFCSLVLLKKWKYAQKIHD